MHLQIVIEKFCFVFNRIQIFRSNSTKFDFWIWDLKFKKSKFEWIQTNSPELNIKYKNVAFVVKRK